jgi:hypothetical protein
MRLTDLEPQFIRYETRIEDYEIIEGDAATWRERGCPTKTVNGPGTAPLSERVQETGASWACNECIKRRVRTLGQLSGSCPALAGLA